MFPICVNLLQVYNKDVASEKVKLMITEAAW